MFPSTGRIRRTPILPGWAIPSGTGKATRWWWTRVGFNDRTELPGAFRHSEALHVVERFHRTDFDHLEWEATIEDPNVFAKPWTIIRTFPLRTDLDKVDEYVCENNKDYKDLFGK